MNALSALDPAGFFQAWQAVRLANPDLKPMGAAGLQQAGLIWRKWLAFCRAHDVAWDAARSADITRFCQAIGPRSQSKKTLPVTLRRYWRVLRDLYAHALATGAVAVNPAEDAKRAATERVPSLALPMNMWRALREGLPSGHAFKDRRNRLALLLMMRAALTERKMDSFGLNHKGVREPGSTPAKSFQACQQQVPGMVEKNALLWRWHCLGSVVKVAQTA